MVYQIVCDLEGETWLGKQRVFQARLSSQRGQGLHCSKGQSDSVTTLLEARVAPRLLGSLAPCLISTAAGLLGTGKNTSG